ncbi:MAG: hypothetical protein ACP5GX_03235 [Anaerolineae bacterium]
MLPASLRTPLRPFIHAQRRQEAAIGAGWGLVAALTGTLVLVIIARLTPLWYLHSLRLFALLLSLMGLVLGALTGWFWPHPLSRRLRQLDRHLCLADRLTTLAELTQGRITAPHAITRLQREETLSTLRDVDVRAALPPRPAPISLRLVIGLTLLLVPALWLPNPQETTLAQQEALRQATETATEDLQNLINEITEESDLPQELREQTLVVLEEALKTLEDPRATTEEKLAALAEAEQQLETLRTPETEAQVERLAEAAPLSTNEVVQPLAEALEKGDLDAAASYLQALASPEGEPLTEEEALALADAFAQMADDLATTDAALAEQLREIAEEIYTGDVDSVSEALEEAATTLSEVGESNAANETLQSTQAQLQEAQEDLGSAQGQSSIPGYPSDEPGMADGPPSPGQGDTGAGAGEPEHGEDSGSTAPFGPGAEPRLDEESDIITLPREEGAGAPEETTGVPSPARVPYREVYGSYSEAAEAELSRRPLPPSLRTYVRTYFSTLEE